MSTEIERVNGPGPGAPLGSGGSAGPDSAGSDSAGSGAVRADQPAAAPSPRVAETDGDQDTRDASDLGLWEILREDWRRHYKSFAHPGLHVLAVYRIGQWRRTRSQPVRGIVTVFYKVVNKLVIRNLYGAELDEQARIGRRVHIGHHQTILIPPHCVIGDDCTLRHNLTIGYASGTAGPRDVPKVGKRVELAPGVHLIGAISIGDDARIGPGSIVMTDVPAGSTVFAAPARVMRPPGR
ncbi:serine acetyltransferase [Frankia casuarinae]|uniref:serine O-acetyltransferase n=1 Tax=Frankia TaxID=1854 RepID=UPI0003D03DAF|nr:MULTISPECIES: serine acetyltransferase [Frankia]ETA03837.1 serine acetyltransferase [Frankia sp. CcI6]EYT93812.1 serine acetyltransferase [Frankia casuarinae]KDA44456.1 serine acetyltransferase [Frankia sp. BMG5.23]KEZ37175.1 serine O-acetyltransferase [Frankia sp. CeD]KFB04415.1 serine O-acetyltransferase [Frankia sp. Allo2]